MKAKEIARVINTFTWNPEVKIGIKTKDGYILKNLKVGIAPINLRTPNGKITEGKIRTPFLLDGSEKEVTENTCVFITAEDDEKESK